MGSQDSPPQCPERGREAGFSIAKETQPRKAPNTRKRNARNVYPNPFVASVHSVVDKARLQATERTPKQEWEYSMEQALGLYVTSLQVDHLQGGRVRHHWMVCKENELDDLVSWGHAPTRQLAAAPAREEIGDLSNGLSRGGRVRSPCTPFIHHL
jgi:hypothetical protein